MITLFRKEISHFFSSLTGPVVIILFLVITGLFTWVFPGSLNIPENGYATLNPLFTIGPWVFLFLIPAITMKLISEEKQSGTIDLLFTKPLSEFQIILAKYLAGLFIVLLSLLPTLVFYYSVYQLGQPKGNLDTGGTWGSFLGLFFLFFVRCLS
ncbi:MAG: ABC transporter permease [Bacteroidota bacterium]